MHSAGLAKDSEGKNERNSNGDGNTPSTIEDKMQGRREANKETPTKFSTGKGKDVTAGMTEKQRGGVS